MSPDRHQNIIRTINSLDPLEEILVAFWSRYSNFHIKTEFKNAVCKMAVILSEPQCVKDWFVMIVIAPSLDQMQQQMMLFACNWPTMS